VAWFKERYKAGDFLWMKDRLPDGGYEKLGERIEAGDLGWLRERVSGLLGSVPGLDLGAYGLSAARTATGAAAGAAGAAALAVSSKRNRKPGSPLWIIPILLFGFVSLTLLLGRCNKSDADSTDVATETEVVADTESSVDTTVASESVETAAGEAVAAETAATETVAVPTEPVAQETVAAVADDTTVVAAETAAAETTVPATEAPTTTTTPPTPPTTVAPVVNAAGDAVSEDLTVYFDNNSSAINAEGQAKVDTATAILAALPAGSKVNVVGHASAVGDPVKNQALSEARANKVVKALKAKLGANASNIEFADVDKSRRVTIEVQK
jgi:outer membrane protein OmpA-like peptidoglycan-associated protein